MSGAPTCNSKFTSALASLLKLMEHMASWVSEIPGESLDGILCARFDESYFSHLYSGQSSRYHKVTSFLLIKSQGDLGRLEFATFGVP